MATKKKPRAAPNLDLYDELEAALAEWLVDLACTPSRMMWDSPLSAYYPLDTLTQIEQKLRCVYDEHMAKHSDICQRLEEDKDFLGNISIKEALRLYAKSKRGRYLKADKDNARKIVIQHICPLAEEVVDIVARYKALEAVRSDLEDCLPWKRPRGRPRDSLRKRMLKKVFLLAYETLRGREFGPYPLSFRDGQPTIVIPPKHPPLVEDYLPATIKILELSGEYVSEKTMGKVRDRLREELIIGPAESSGLEPIKKFYQNSATKAEKTFLIKWVLNIGLHGRRKDASEFLRTPVS